MPKAFLNNLKQYAENIRWYANICKRILDCMRIFASEYSLGCEIRLKFCVFSLVNEFFEANIRQFEKILSKYSPVRENLKQRFNATCIFINHVVTKTETEEFL